MRSNQEQPDKFVSSEQRCIFFEDDDESEWDTRTFRDLMTPGPILSLSEFLRLAASESAQLSKEEDNNDMYVDEINEHVQAHVMEEEFRNGSQNATVPSGANHGGNNIGAMSSLEEAATTRDLIERLRQLHIRFLSLKK